MPSFILEFNSIALQNMKNGLYLIVKILSNSQSKASLFPGEFWAVNTEMVSFISSTISSSSSPLSLKNHPNQHSAHICCVVSQFYSSQTHKTGISGKTLEQAAQSCGVSMLKIPPDIDLDNLLQLEVLRWSQEITSNLNNSRYTQNCCSRSRQVKEYI